MVMNVARTFSAMSQDARIYSHAVHASFTGASIIRTCAKTVRDRHNTGSVLRRFCGKTPSA